MPSRIVLPIEGMTCGACAVTVQSRLARAPGVLDASVNYATGRATVLLADGGPEVAELVKAIRDAGYDCGKALVEFPVEGLHYATGTARLEHELRQLRGVLAASANQALETVRVEYVPGLVTAREMEDAVARAGFTVSEPVPEEDPVARERLARRREQGVLLGRLAVAALAAVVTMLLSMPLMTGGAKVEHDLAARLMHGLDGFLRGALPPLYALEGRPGLLKLVMLLVTVPVV